MENRPAPRPMPATAGARRAEAPAAAQPEPAAPDWVRDAWTGLADEVKLYFADLVACTFTPRRFLQQWRDGERKAVNPFGFFGTALTLSTILSFLLEPAPAAGAAHGPAWLDWVEPSLPYLTVLAAAAVSHVCFKLGGTRVPLRGTVASAMFVTGGPLTVLLIPLQIAADLLGHGAGSGSALMLLAHLALAGVAVAGYLFWNGLALRGLHHDVPARWTWLAVLAQLGFLITVVAGMFVFAAFVPGAAT